MSVAYQLQLAERRLATTRLMRRHQVALSQALRAYRPHHI